jgi:hypothetical protein
VEVKWGRRDMNKGWLGKDFEVLSMEKHTYVPGLNAEIEVCGCQF